MSRSGQVGFCERFFYVWQAVEIDWAGSRDKLSRNREKIKVGALKSSRTLPTGKTDLAEVSEVWSLKPMNHHSEVEHLYDDSCTSEWRPGLHWSRSSRNWVQQQMIISGEICKWRVAVESRAFKLFRGLGCWFMVPTCQGKKKIGFST